MRWDYRSGSSQVQQSWAVPTTHGYPEPAGTEPPASAQSDKSSAAEHLLLGDAGLFFFIPQSSNQNCGSPSTQATFDQHIFCLLSWECPTSTELTGLSTWAAANSQLAGVPGLQFPVQHSASPYQFIASRRGPRDLIAAAWRPIHNDQPFMMSGNLVLCQIKSPLWILRRGSILSPELLLRFDRLDLSELET